MEAPNIEGATNHFDTSFIKDYKAKSNNYSKDKLIIIQYSC